MAFSLRHATVLGLLPLLLGACGVRQFNAKVLPGTGSGDGGPQGSLFAAFGPFHSSGQVNGAMTSPACGSMGTRPCVKARASVGMPYHFDRNTVAGANSAMAGPLPGTAHASVAGAGRTQVSSGPRAPDHPRLENRDQRLMKRQGNPGDHAF